MFEVERYIIYVYIHYVCPFTSLRCYIFDLGISPSKKLRRWTSLSLWPSGGIPQSPRDDRNGVGLLFGLHMSKEKRAPGYIGFVGDSTTLVYYMGTMINHSKDPY